MALDLVSMVIQDHGVKTMNIIDIAIPSRSIVPEKSAALDEIVYSIGETVAGQILVARTSVGVCAILIGADGEALKNDLATRFPNRTRIWSASQLTDELRKIARFIDKPAEGLDLSLDMRHGTRFQRRVWDALRTIPCGATVTYAALARRIGEPNGARAVASACAANAIVLGIPCHRVIRSGGTLSGYRWGVELKRALLNKEAMA
jgi:O-6-methylguanine DNA methyltransferase